MEVVSLALDAVGRRAAPEGDLGVDEDEEGAVGQKATRRDQVQLEHALDAELTRDALIRERRVDVAVAENVATGSKRGSDHAVDELGACGGEERGLGPRTHLQAVEQEATDLFAERRATRLARRDDVASLSAERVREQVRLRGLSGPVESFEGEEHRRRTIRRVRAVVTGGAGFIGSHVVDALLARGDEVHVLDDLSSGTRGNVADGARLHEGDVRRDAASVFAEVKPEIYGECEAPAAEDHPRRPLAPYGVSKLAAEEYIAAYNRLHGTRHVSLRYGNVYGPRQDPHGEAGVVAIFMNALRDGKTPRIYGDGTQTRDYVNVADVVAATLAASGHDGGGVFNVGTAVETSVLDLYERVQRAAGIEREPDFAEARPGELQRSVLDPSLAQRELGWKLRRSLDAGLAETWAWISG